MSGDGVVAHNRRTYFAENVDPTRTRLNVEYCYTPIEEAYHQLFDAALSEFNAKQKRKDRCIENYYEKIRDGKQEKPFYEVIFQVGNKDDMGTVGENAELAKTILDKFYRSFLERNPHLRVYSAHLHMDEATPHLHIDFIPFTTGSKRGLSTRVSLKQALADQGITGEGRSLTERDLWVQKEKEALAEIMLEHGIEWEQKGEHKEHLSVLDFKREKRKEELAELEQSIERVQQQQVSIQAVEQIEVKPLPLTSKVAVDREDYQNLVTAAQKYVVQEKQEGKLKKLLKEAKKLDFLDFIRDADSTVYNGTWSVYFVKRNFSSDLMGMKDIRTGKITFDEGVVYEMSDDKFIFNLMNFPKHSCFEMTNLFDILKKNYKLIEGVGENGGYHAQVFMSSLFSQMDFS